MLRTEERRGAARAWRRHAGITRLLHVDDDDILGKVGRQISTVGLSGKTSRPTSTSRSRSTARPSSRRFSSPGTA